jgi:hypothetical protein
MIIDDRDLWLVLLHDDKESAKTYWTLPQAYPHSYCRIMSLATTSASMPVGGASGGLMMAHQAQAMALPAARPPPGPQLPDQGTGLPVSSAALGADLVDKSQLTMKQVKNVSHLPIVAVDLYGTDPMVASFPPKPKEPDLKLKATLVGKFQPQVSFQKTETAHKTLRKYLTKDKTYDELRSSALATSKSDDCVTIEKPHLWMGMRRVQDTPEYIKDNGIVPLVIDEDIKGATSALSEEASLDSVHITNGTLDGVSSPTGNDFDRVVYKVRLASSKKAVTMLPEEVSSLILAVAQTSVARKNAIDDDPMDYPLALALPAWACHDAALEAWMDSIPGAVFYQRSIAALCGALQPGNSENPLLQRISTVVKAMQAAHQKLNDGTIFEYEPLVVLVGVNDEGVECTAVQVSDVQNDIPACLFGNYKVLCSNSYPTKEGMAKLEDCLTDLYNNIGDIAPEIEGPVSFVAYGTNTNQVSLLKKSLERVRTKLDTWEKVPVIDAKIDCVAVGTAVLGAVTHGRLATLIQGANDKPKPALAMRVHNVAPTAVGVKMSYKTGVWTPVKTIFDFDRRVPAGPYGIELSAAQCAAMLQAGAGEKDDWDSDELKKALEAAMKDVDGRKGIPKRESAALAFKIQVVQKITRDGEWINVGNPTMALTKVDEDKRVACEKIKLELSVNSIGVITASLVGQL